MRLHSLESRAKNLRRSIAVATTFAVAVAAPVAPVFPGGSLNTASAQTAVPLPDGVSNVGVVVNGADWKTDVFFNKPMTVRTVTVEFVPPSTSNPRKDSAPDGDPVLNKIPVERMYRLEHVRNRQVIGTSEVVGRRTLTKTPSGRNAINIVFDLPNPVEVSGVEKISFIAPGEGANYPIPFLSGTSGSRFTRVGINEEPAAPVASSPVATSSSTSSTVTAPATTSTLTTSTVTAPTTTSTLTAAATTVTPSVTVTTTPTVVANPTAVVRTSYTTTSPMRTVTTTPIVTAAPATATVTAAALTTTPTQVVSTTPTVTARSTTATVTAPGQTVTPTARTFVRPTMTEAPAPVTAPASTVTHQAPPNTLKQTTTAPTFTATRTVTSTPTVTARPSVTPTTTVTGAAVTVTPTTWTKTPTTTQTKQVTVTAAPVTRTKTSPTTVTPTVTVTRTVRPSPAPSTALSSQSSAATSPTQATQPASRPISWGDVRTRVGELSVSTPIGDVAVPEAANYTTVSVLRRDTENTKNTETATPLTPAETNWIRVEESGALVVAPPAGTAPGRYEVVIASATTGQRDTVTVTVEPPVPMSERYTVGVASVATPAGASRTAPAPRASVVEGGFHYEDRALPAGTGFEVDVPGAVVDKQGRVTYTPPVGAEPGIVRVPVKVTFPDGSTGAYEVEFVVGEPLMADRFPLAYESGLSVKAGDAAALFTTGTAQLPQGTTFALRNGYDLGGWLVSVDKHTGALRVVAPSSGGEELTVPVVAYFPDGSTREISAKVSVADSAKLASSRSLTYDPVTATRGSLVTLDVRGTAPEGTTYQLAEGEGKIAVGAATGRLTFTVPDGASAGDAIALRVRATYPDRSATELVGKVNVVDMATLHPVKFANPSSGVSGTQNLAQTLAVPAGTRFAISPEFKERGWDVTVDPVTGQLRVSADASLVGGNQTLVPVQVTYPDGSVNVVAVPVTAPEPAIAPAQQPQPGQKPRMNWIPAVVGAIAALAGVGFALWLNRDEVRRALAQFGIII